MTNLTRILFIFTFLILNFSTTYAHGPSRQKVSESIEINASIEDVWKIISNFRVFNWNQNIKQTIADNNQVGSERILEFKSGGKGQTKVGKS